MDVNNYYSISCQNNQLVIKQNVSKIQKSSLPDILSTLIKLNADQYTHSNFGEIWNDIKARIEHKKSGFTGWIVNIFYFLSGRNSLINQIDLQVIRITQHVILETIKSETNSENKSEIYLFSNSEITQSQSDITQSQSDITQSQNAIINQEPLDPFDQNNLEEETLKNQYETNQKIMDQLYQSILERNNKAFYYYIGELEKSSPNDLKKLNQIFLKKVWNVQMNLIYWLQKSIQPIEKVKSKYSNSFDKFNNSELLEYRSSALETSIYYPMKINHEGKKHYLMVHDEMTCAEFITIYKILKPEFRKDSFHNSTFKFLTTNDVWKKNERVKSIKENGSVTVRLVGRPLDGGDKSNNNQSGSTEMELPIIQEWTDEDDATLRKMEGEYAKYESQIKS